MKNRHTERMGLLYAGAFFAAAVLLYRHYLPPVRKPGRSHYPYALLLGCASHQNGSPSSSQRIRVEKAVECWRDGLFDTLIISGAAVANKYVEAQEMARMVHQLEPDLPVHEEAQARNTWQNFENTKAITGDQPLLIITGSTHACRASAMARSFFSEYGVACGSDRKLKRLRKELGSRFVYVTLELKKDLERRGSK